MTNVDKINFAEEVNQELSYEEEKERLKLSLDKSKQYLGDFDVTEKYDFTKEDIIRHFVTSYGNIQGEHHQFWLNDTVMKILNNCPVIIKEARWDNGLTELRITVKDNDEHLEWIEEQKHDPIDGPDSYYYDRGTPP